MDAEKITKRIQERIMAFDERLDAREEGTVISCGDGIARICGLRDVMANELLWFPHGVCGIAMNLEEELVGAVLGIPVRIIMPDSVSEERRKLVRHYGAEVILIHDAGNIGDCIEECLQTALRMQREDPKVFVPQQFSNPGNLEAHHYHTAVEILEQVAGPIHGFCSGVGTGGTISGIGEVLRSQNPGMLIWAVEPENAAILSGGSVGTHLQMGIGDGVIPENLNQEIYDDICIVTDEEAIRTAKELARREGLMCGISSGTNVAAALKLAKKLGKGKTVLTILPDTAERYFSTPLFSGE